MKWQAITLIVYFALNALSGVALIGKPRPPITPGVAVALVVIYAGLIWITTGAAA